MNRWHEIEQAAADRRARDLRNGQEAQMLRAARGDQSLRRRLRCWQAQIRHVLHQRRLRHTTRTADVSSVAANQ